MLTSGSIRLATREDEPFLWEMLAAAGHEPDVASARSRHVVAMHLEGWKRPHDFGVIARDSEMNSIGAAWARQFHPSERPTFYVNDRTPELVIGVAAAARGQGVGTRLIEALLLEAKAQGAVGLMLSVRDTNPALRLYQRQGFERIEGAFIDNRVGGVSFAMQRPVDLHIQ